MGELTFCHELHCAIGRGESVGWATLVVAVPTRCLQDVMGDLSRGHRRTANEVSGSGVNTVQLSEIA